MSKNWPAWQESLDDPIHTDGLLRDLQELQDEQQRAEALRLRQVNDKLERKLERGNPVLNILRAIGEWIADFWADWYPIIITIVVMVVFFGTMIWLITASQSSQEAAAKITLQEQQAACVQVGGKVVDNDVCYFPTKDVSIDLS